MIEFQFDKDKTGTSNVDIGLQLLENSLYEGTSIAASYLYLKLKKQEELSKIELNIEGISDDSIDSFTAQSLLGTPIHEIIKFKYSGDGETKELVLGRVPNQDIFYDVPIMNVSRSKTIVKTPTNGKKSSTKELYGFEDYKITIQGILLNTDSFKLPPYEQINALEEFDSIEDAIEVESRYLQSLNVHSLVIEDIAYMRVKDTPNMVMYNISAVSDEPFELEYNESKRKLING